MIVTGLLVKELETTCTHYSVKSFNKRIFIGTYFRIMIASHSLFQVWSLI